MRRLGLFLAFVLAVVAMATVAVAGTDPHAEKERLTPADMALAKRVVLKPTDLAPGWRGTPSTPDDNEQIKCPGYDPDFSAFTITGKAESGFERSAGAVIMSVAEVYATRAQAVGDFRTGAKPGVAKCLRHFLEAEFRKSGGSVTATVLSSRMVAAPRVGERAAAYRLVAKIEGNGVSLPVYMDLLAFQGGRSIAILFFTGVAKPVPGQVALARVVAARMR